METLSKFTFKQQPLCFSLHRNHHHSLSLPKPNSITFHKPRFSPIKITSKSTSTKIATNPNSRNPFGFLKTPVTIAVATAAVFVAGLSHKPNPAFAGIAPPMVEEKNPRLTDEELEEYVAEHPDDVDGLKSLMETRIKNKKLPEAIEVLNRLVELEPEEKEWYLLRAHMYSYMGETEMAKSGFEEIISKDPIRVEAYHGLVMAVSNAEESNAELNVVTNRIERAIEICKKDKKKEEIRDFRLLIAQVRVIEGKYDDALEVYQELVKEEPRDFRPYLCQGIIYTLLRKKDEADKQFDKYKRLVPQGHPYAQFFDDNMIATKVFSQMAENERSNATAAGVKGL